MKQVIKIVVMTILASIQARITQAIKNLVIINLQKAIFILKEKSTNTMTLLHLLLVNLIIKDLKSLKTKSEKSLLKILVSL